jgi:hypothetical protein
MRMAAPGSACGRRSSCDRTVTAQSRAPWASVLFCSCSPPDPTPGAQDLDASARSPIAQPRGADRGASSPARLCSVRVMDQVGPIRRFIIDHDDKWLFTVSYIGAAVLLSIWISLFWLLVVVGVHFAFELARCRHHAHSWSSALAVSAWEVKLDVALVAFALALAVYMDVLLGVAGLQGAARVGANAGRAVRGGTRFMVWKRVLRGVLLSVDDAAQVGRAALRARRKKRGEPDDETDDEPENQPENEDDTTREPSGSPWRGSWGLADRLCPEGRLWSTRDPV